MIWLSFATVVVSAAFVGYFVEKKNYTHAGIWVGLLILNTISYVESFFNLGAGG